MVALAIETAMGRGEILRLRWEDIDLDKKTVFLSKTKNDSSGWAPLNDEAFAKLSKAPTSTDRPFPVNEVAFRQARNRLQHRADVSDLAFHDLRHETISRMFDSGIKMHKVIALSGQKAACQLFRYVQL